MPDPRPRVFISSVMDGYAQFRDAAADGIRQAGCEPVRAEDFPAAGHSPRNACLDGVRSADALVLADLSAPVAEIDRSLTMLERAFQEWENTW